MGLVLGAEERLAPSERDAFLVTDERLLVRALSRAGEALLERTEPSAIHGPVSALVMGVNPDGSPDAPLLRLLVAAATGALSIAVTHVALTADPRRRFTVRLGPCGPPAAALLVFEQEDP